MMYDLRLSELPSFRQEVRPVNMAVIHCSATTPRQDVTVADITRWHRLRGFRTCGYHFFIKKDGLIYTGRPLTEAGAHAAGYNAASIGICYEGGLDASGNAKDTRTIEQKASLVALLIRLREDYSRMRILGHNDLNLHKMCPCFCCLEYAAI